MELLEALRLREVADFLLLFCLLSFLPLVLRPLPMENAAKASELALRPALMQGQWPQEQLPGSQEQLVGSQEQLP